MYQEHFGLQQEPFSIAPDPAFLFLSDAHNEALAHLMYGFSHGGFVLITGEVGTGKTTLLRNLLDRTPPDIDVAFILNPRLTVRELLETVCDELGVDYPQHELSSVKQYIDVLNKHLLRTHQAGRSTVVVIDEAQNLSPAVLEQIRLLTNLETNEKKLLRIILLGQPELDEILSRTELRQLAQRITARYTLTPLGKSEVQAYLSHRLARAGGNPGIFTDGAVSALYRLSKGTPRLINVIADRAMLGAYVEGKYQITAKLIKNGAKEVLGNNKASNIPYRLIGAVVVLAIALAAGWQYLSPQLVQTFAPKVSSAEDSEKGAAEKGSDPFRVDSEMGSDPLEVDPLVVALRGSDPDVAAPLQETEEQSVEVSSPTTSEAPAREIRQAPQKLAANKPLARPPGRTFEVQRKAYQAVFAQWGATYPLDSSQIPCDFAPTVGLQCLSRKGSWSELASLNTPVVLELWDDKNSPFYAALIHSEDTYHEIRLGEDNIGVTPKDLRDAWFGAYVLLWQTPPDYNGSLRQGDNHPTVQWLHERLQELLPSTQLSTPQRFFSAELREAVIEFQQAEGLLADGIVGPLTWIRLSDRLDLPAPKLRS